MNEKIITFEYSGKSYKMEVSRVSGEKIGIQYHVNVTNSHESYIFVVDRNGEIELPPSEKNGQFLLTIAIEIRKVFPKKHDLQF